MTLAQPASEIEFLLNTALQPRLADDKLELERLGRVQAHIGIDRYRLRAQQPVSHFTISYQGRVAHGLSGTTQTYAGGREDSAGLISGDVRPLVRMNVQVIVEQDGRREQGNAGGGAREGLGYFLQQERGIGYAREAVRQALVNLDAVAAPAGLLPVVLEQNVEAMEVFRFQKWRRDRGGEHASCGDRRRRRRETT